jgi:hypothetical protein
MNAEDFQTLNDLLVKVSTEDSARVDDKSKRVGYLNKLAEVIRSSILFCSDLDIARIIIEKYAVCVVTCMCVCLVWFNPMHVSPALE